MKCPSCGAEMRGNVCEYCGSRRPRERVNRTGAVCPKCGSSNVQTCRESYTWYLQKTTGMCRDCGNSWSMAGESTAMDNAPQLLLWIFGWMMCFPIPVTILILRGKSLPKWAKYALIAGVWLIYVLPYLSVISNLFFF